MLAMFMRRAGGLEEHLYGQCLSLAFDMHCSLLARLFLFYGVNKIEAFRQRFAVEGEEPISFLQPGACRS